MAGMSTGRSPRRRLIHGAPQTRPGWRPADLLALFKRSFQQWNEDKIPKLAAALAFYTSFSVAPILLIAVVVAGLVFGAGAARGAISREISGLVGERVGEGIEMLLKSTWQPRSGVLATVLGGIALVFGASGVFGELQDSLNVIWRVKKKSGRGLWGTLRDRFLSFALVLGIGFLLLVSLVLSTVLAALGQAFLGWGGQGVLMRLLNQALTLVVITSLFGAAFKLLPDAAVRWRDVGPGAFLTAVLFTLGKFLIGLYLGTSTVGSTYGAAGSFVLMMLWIYYSSQIFYFGAEFTKAWSDTRGRPATPKADAVRV